MAAMRFVLRHAGEPPIGIVHYAVARSALQHEIGTCFGPWNLGVVQMVHAFTTCDHIPAVGRWVFAAVASHRDLLCHQRPSVQYVIHFLDAKSSGV